VGKRGRRGEERDRGVREERHLELAKLVADEMQRQQFSLQLR
jgi:hypothetical protein